MKKLTKDQKARLQAFTNVAEALEAKGIKVLGKTKEGLVIANDAQADEAIVVKVVVKKNAIAKADVVPFVNLEDTLEAIKAFKAKADAEKAKEDEA